MRDLRHPVSRHQGLTTPRKDSSQSRDRSLITRYHLLVEQEHQLSNLCRACWSLGPFCRRPLRASHYSNDMWQENPVSPNNVARSGVEKSNAIALEVASSLRKLTVDT